MDVPNSGSKLATTCAAKKLVSIRLTGKFPAIEFDEESNGQTLRLYQSSPAQIQQLIGHNIAASSLVEAYGSSSTVDRSNFKSTLIGRPDIGASWGEKSPFLNLAIQILHVS
ncbi:hypothetical protein V3C99_009188 [Haemonchus contortus]|uniref:KTSC domain-containing protein n=1 Tax=Haemonchus contortus TaxID=6289 RepID=A0A7I5EAN8_HAECO